MTSLTTELKWLSLWIPMKIDNDMRQLFIFQYEMNIPEILVDPPNFLFKKGLS